MTKAEYEGRSRPFDKQSSQSYEKYKASLHAFFDGKAPLPERIRQVVGSEENAAVRQEVGNCAPADSSKKTRRLAAVSPRYSELVDSIRNAPREKLPAQIDALLEEGFPFPADDEEVLAKALEHPRDVVVEQVLIAFKNYLSKQKSKNPRLLKLRLENARLMSSSVELQSLCMELEKKL